MFVPVLSIDFSLVCILLSEATDGYSIDLDDFEWFEVGKRDVRGRFNVLNSNFVNAAEIRLHFYPSYKLHLM